MAVTVYGSSDDLIEVEGDVDDEFYALSDAEDGSILAFSNGTVLRIAYTDDGVWRITRLSNGAGVLTVDQAPADDEDNYTDRATIAADIAWVVCGSSWAHR